MVPSGIQTGYFERAPAAGPAAEARSGDGRGEVDPEDSNCSKFRHSGSQPITHRRHSHSHPDRHRLARSMRPRNVRFRASFFHLRRIRCAMPTLKRAVGCLRGLPLPSRRESSVLRVHAATLRPHTRHLQTPPPNKPHSWPAAAHPTGRGSLLESTTAVPPSRSPGGPRPACSFARATSSSITSIDRWLRTGSSPSTPRQP